MKGFIRDLLLAALINFIELILEKLSEKLTIHLQSIQTNLAIKYCVGE